MWLPSSLHELAHLRRAITHPTSHPLAEGVLLLLHYEWGAAITVIKVTHRMGQLIVKRDPRRGFARRDSAFPRVHTEQALPSMGLRQKSIPWMTPCCGAMGPLWRNIYELPVCLGPGLGHRCEPRLVLAPWGNSSSKVLVYHSGPSLIMDRKRWS